MSQLTFSLYVRHERRPDAAPLSMLLVISSSYTPHLFCAHALFSHAALWLACTDRYRSPPLRASHHERYIPRTPWRRSCCSVVAPMSGLDRCRSGLSGGVHRIALFVSRVVSVACDTLRVTSASPRNAILRRAAAACVRGDSADFWSAIATGHITASCFASRALLYERHGDTSARLQWRRCLA